MSGQVGASVAWSVDDLGDGRAACVVGVVEKVDGARALVRPYAGQGQRAPGGVINERPTEPQWVDAGSLSVMT